MHARSANGPATLPLSPLNDRNQAFHFEVLMLGNRSRQELEQGQEVNGSTRAAITAKCEYARKMPITMFISAKLFKIDRHFLAFSFSLSALVCSHVDPNEKNWSI